MDINSYCESLEKQLIAWKAKIYDVIRIVETLSGEKKKTVSAPMQSLHAIVAEIDAHLEQLKTACPPDWSPNRETIDNKMIALRKTLQKLSENVGGPLIPDSLSWVSE